MRPGPLPVLLAGVVVLLLAVYTQGRLLAECTQSVGEHLRETAESIETLEDALRAAHARIHELEAEL